MSRPITLVASLTLVLLAAGAITCLLPDLLFSSLDETGLRARYPLLDAVPQRELVDCYYAYSHTIFVLLLLGTVIVLLRRLYVNTTGPYVVIDKSGIRNTLGKLRAAWPTLLLFLAYGLVMIDETSFYHIEIVSWYAGIYKNDLLNNFSLNERLVSETMRRADFRFFPLAHQDLQVLGWFTPYIKVWILVSVLELFLIVYLAKRFVTALTGREIPHLLLAASLLLLLSSGTARAFFQLIYAERMLVLLFAIFALAYLRYQQTRREKYFYLALLSAWIGIFFKDIAIILFIGLPFLHTSVDLIRRYPDDLAPRPWRERWTMIKRDYPLETALAGLAVVWLGLYLFLSFLPSLIAGQGAYNQESHQFRFRFDPGETRLNVVLLMLAVRPVLMVFRRTAWGILDSLNLTAALYAAALWSLVGWSTHSYMALPVYFVGLINLLYLLIWLFSLIRARTRTATIAIAVSASCVAALLSFEAIEGRSFVDVIEEYKTQQLAWRMTMKRANRALRNKRHIGETANLVFTESWFNHRKHLDRLQYDRLVYLDPTDGTYLIMDGRHRGTLYLPQHGDLLINIDEDDLSFLGDELGHWHLLYAFDEALPYARIYEYR